jgi:hypothetical protein
MSIYIKGQEGCKMYYNGQEMCVGYLNGQKVFGCRNTATVSDNSATLSSKSYTFKESDFTNNFTTDSPFTYNEVYLRSLPKVDLLKLVGVNATIGDKFKAINSSGLKFLLDDKYAIYSGVMYRFAESIDSIVQKYEDLGYKLTDNTSGKLTFTHQDNPNDTIVVSGSPVDNKDLEFVFQVTDTSPQQILTNEATFSLVPQGDVNIKPVYVNNPPVVGDNTVTMKRSEIRVFSRRDFVDDTDPRFSDPEGDQPYKLRVDTLPTTGTLKLRGVAMTAEQIIDFIDDIDAQVFTYTPDPSQNVEGVSFRFSVSDTGSKQFG